MVLVDQDLTSLQAAVARANRCGFAGHMTRIHGDANEIVSDIVSAIPPYSLNIAFVDPYSLDINYKTIETLARNRTLDLIILFSDRIDLQRNIDDVYLPQQSSKLDSFLGPESNWRKRYLALDDRTGPKVRGLFADIYRDQLGRLGYEHTESWPLTGPQGPMFRLFFASKHPLGLKFCRIALKEDFEGNKGLF
jgi:three-Cys-motif partner protein